MRTLGVCFGASTLSMVSLKKDQQGVSIEDIWRKPHEGNPKQLFLEAMGDIHAGDHDRIAITGRGFKRLLNLTFLCSIDVTCLGCQI